MKISIDKFIYIIALLTLSCSLSGQNMQLLSYQASNGVEYKKGVQLRLGQGTTSGKTFKYINANYAGPDGSTNLPAQYVGQLLEVVKIRQYGNKKEGYKIYLICDSGPTNYWVEIEAAIDSGEVVNDGSN